MRAGIIIEFENSVLKNKPRFFYHILSGLANRDLYGLITIRGPRRVGKTTLVKLLIRQLIDDGVDSNRIFYASLDYQGPNSSTSISPLNLITRVAGSSDQEKYLFLDEVSMYSDWATEMKNVYDLGLIQKGKLKIIATGSHSMDLAEAASKLRGRQGQLAEKFNVGGNLLQPPLRFPEIVEGLQPQIHEHISQNTFRRPASRFACLLKLQNGTIPETLQNIYDNYFQLLQITFEDYLVHGGYPKAVDEFYKTKPNHVNPGFYFNVADLLISDCATAYLDPENLVRILRFLLEPKRLSNAMSLENSPVIGIDGEGRPRGKFGAKGYLDYLKTTWSFFFSYPEGDNCIPNYQQQPKVYILDPFLYHALTARINNKPNPFDEARKSLNDLSFKGLFVQSIVAAHLLLAQQFFEHIPAVDYERVLMYRNGTEGEADYVLCVSKDSTSHRFTIESKYSETPDHLNKVPTEGMIVLTKDKLEVRNDKVLIPVSLFLLLL